ncbi:hypothetical protein EAJ12_21050 [Phocaeicola vulgatus]|nr:hypothetical protein EAJ12_21050 [Phocaeicola vulgatus]
MKYIYSYFELTLNYMLKYKIPQIVTLTQKSHRISNFLLHQIAYFCGQYINKKPLKYSYFSDFHDFPFCKSGATRNRTFCFGLF